MYSYATTNYSKIAVKSYEINDKVLCRHIDNLYYEAKIIAVEQSDNEAVYTVHYQGWNQRHDEKIPHNATLERFLEYTPANIEKAKTELKDAQARVLQSKRKGKKHLSDEKKGGTDSRGSTPSDKRGASSSRAASVTSEKCYLLRIILLGSSAVSQGRKRKSAQTGDTEPIVDFVRKNEIKIEMPLVLKEILVDDQDMIVRQMHIPRIPARFTVSDIIRQYAEYMGNSLEAKESLLFELGGDETQMKSTIVTMIESSYGMRDYFNSTLGSQLLYKFERPQYTDLLAEFESKEDVTKPSSTKKAKSSSPETEDKFKPSEQYGFIHLLRLFVRFGSMLSLATWTDRAVQTIVGHVHNFLKFLEVNRHKFFDLETDYIVSTPEYQKRVWNS
ncbi:unnamed protein product [Dracunculus medinensis]|uniref:MRG domain-containing protein n=1 Tax=Dracunculus medinensis TaxID=318479 RepID=A0A0N4UIZ0_DRAME|nr:unnamed protein product [Dracunculus medinensis]